jgi:hypothetical protein
MRKTLLLVCLAGLFAGVVVVLSARPTLAAFTSQTSNPGNAVTAAADFRASGSRRAEPPAS